MSIDYWYEAKWYVHVVVFKTVLAMIRNNIQSEIHEGEANKDDSSAIRSPAVVHFGLKYFITLGKSDDPLNMDPFGGNFPVFLDDICW